MENPLIIYRQTAGDEDQPWLLSMMDLMAIIAIFFIMLLSFADFDPTKFQEISDSLQNVFKARNQSAAQYNPSKETDKILVAIKKSMDKFISTNKVGHMIYTKLDDDGLLIVNNDPYLFLPGQAELSKHSRFFIRFVSKLLKKFPFIIKVEGHTDSQPIHTKQFSSNWNLSAARAIGVIRALGKRGVPEKRFVAVGYGPYRPIANNTTEKGRALNRRIVIAVERNEVYEKVKMLIEKRKKLLEKRRKKAKGKRKTKKQHAKEGKE